MTKSIEYFEQAVTKDASYALAYAGLADCYNLLGYYGLRSPRESFRRAKQAALRALHLDDSLVEAHVSMGFANAVYEWDWVAAEREFRRAIEIKPDYSTAHQWYGEYLAGQGRDVEAQAELRRAQELDPLSVITHAASGLVLYFGHHYEDAIVQLQKAVELDNNFWPAHWLLGTTLAIMQRYQDAIVQIETAQSLSGGNPRMLGELGFVHAVSGNRSALQTVLSQLRRLSKERYVSSFNLAMIAAGRGLMDEALDALHRSCKERTWDIAYLNHDPKLDSLRTDPRFGALLKQIGHKKKGSYIDSVHILQGSKLATNRNS